MSNRLKKLLININLSSKNKQKIIKQYSITRGIFSYFFSLLGKQFLSEDIGKVSLPIGVSSLSKKSFSQQGEDLII